MAYFFSQHPFVQYDPTGQNAPVLATDITKSFRLSEVTQNRKLVYYEYEIKERDRPDTIAERYYGNSKLDWIVFLTNKIRDPYFEWPLTYMQFDAYIKQKYGSVANALETIHHYEQIIVARNESYANFDLQTIVIPEKTLIVDYTTYASLPAASRKSVTSYDYEEMLNNDKRRIKILDKAFVPGLLKELRGIFK